LSHPLLSQEKLLRLIARKHLEIQRITDENAKLKELLSQAPALLDELKDLKAQNQVLRVQMMLLEARNNGEAHHGGSGNGNGGIGGGGGNDGPMYLS
jgi:hypothetical protein